MFMVPKKDDKGNRKLDDCYLASLDFDSKK